MRSALLPFVLGATPATAFAQAPAHLVGLTAQIPVLLHRDQSTCNNVSCTPPGFPQTLALPNAGGTGWDPVLSGAWISNGPVLACVDDNCNYLCPPGPSPVPPGALITGLEVVESLNEIWATDSLSNLVRISRACPSAMLSSCNTGVPFTPTRGTSGLAVDEGLQLVFIAAADWVSGASQLRISTMASPCTPFQVLPIGGCAGPGFTIAGVCGPFFVTAATLGTLGPVTATGGIGCAANAQFLLPIPLAPALAGLPIASQCFAWCPAGTGGTSLSNC